jgi:BlaI family transcriptional regulator, penicillinase repressor
MKISAAESRVMEVLWRHGSPMAADDVVEALGDAAEWSAGTVRTLLTRLVNKKALGTKKNGKRYLYRPLIKREDYVHAESVSFLDRMFDGRIAPLVAHFTERAELSDQEVAELRALIERLGHGR